MSTNSRMWNSETSKSYRIWKLKFVFWIVQYSRLHNLEYKFVFQIVEFEMDNFKFF